MGAEERSVKLVQIAPFRLGEVLVDPPTRRIVNGEKFEILEPRIMQVLVVLAEAPGSVVSRDELIERCWGGRIVGENAIHRAISRIRACAIDSGPNGFRLETIARVGYRILPADPETEFETPPAPGDLWPAASHSLPSTEPPKVATNRAGWSRRTLVAGGVATAAIAASAGLFAWTRVAPHRPPAEAVELVRLAQIAQRQGHPDQVRQAISFFREATRIDPQYAEAWGGLALSYRHVLEGFAEGQLDSLPGLIRSAAARALAIDPENVDAQVAMVIIPPNFKNWRQIESRLIPLGAKYPDHWFIQAQLGIIRYEVGRWSDGLAHTERQLRNDPYIPIGQLARARALWALGRLQEAEAALEMIMERWPGNYMAWNMRFQLLLLTGRPGSAVAFVMDPELRPEGLRPTAIETRQTIARAAEHGARADVEASLADLRAQRDGGLDGILGVAPLLVLLGQPGDALDGLETYYFGGDAGPPRGLVAPPRPYERRFTQFLFGPGMAPLWQEDRFKSLLQNIGLEEYWRQSNTLPDFRR